MPGIIMSMRTTLISGSDSRVSSASCPSAAPTTSRSLAMQRARQRVDVAHVVVDDEHLLAGRTARSRVPRARSGARRRTSGRSGAPGGGTGGSPRGSAPRALALQDDDRRARSPSRRPSSSDVSAAWVWTTIGRPAVRSSALTREKRSRPRSWSPIAGRAPCSGTSASAGARRRRPGSPRSRCARLIQEARAQLVVDGAVGIDHEHVPGLAGRPRPRARGSRPGFARPRPACS